MKTLLLVLALFAVLVLVEGERNHLGTREEGEREDRVFCQDVNANGKKKNDKEKGGQHRWHHCRYEDNHGKEYNLKPLASHDVKASLDGSTYYFNPCHTVKATQCPKGSAVCEITTKGEAIAHGLTSSAHWADGAMGSNASIKIIYDRGETCPTGEPRKVDVELHCRSLAGPSTDTSVKAIVKENCYLKLILETPYACDTQALCSSITGEETCEENLCEWINAQEKCVAPRQWIEQPLTWVFMAVLAFGVVGSLAIMAACAGFAFWRVSHRVQLPSFNASPGEEQELALLETVPLETPYHPLLVQQTTDVSVTAGLHGYPVVHILPGHHLQEHPA